MDPQLTKRCRACVPWDLAWAGWYCCNCVIYNPRECAIYYNTAIQPAQIASNAEKAVAKGGEAGDMKTLILSCSTGGGHNSCAKAIKEWYDIKGQYCEIKDALAFVSLRFSKFIAWGHTTMYRHLPWLFRFGYSCSEKHSGMFQEGSFTYQLLAKGADGLAEYINREKFDAVICTHVFAALMLNEVRKRHKLMFVSSLVTTDYTCFPGAKEGQVDRYFVPHADMIGDFESHGIELEKLKVSGIPVRQSFYVNTPKEMAKLNFHIPIDHKHVVMSCGSMGCGPMKKLASILERDMPVDCDLTVVCGTNEKLYKKLVKKYAGSRNIHVTGYVQNMSLLLDSADLYLTKPGGISVTEAAVKHLPIVLIDAVAGCELYNRIHFIRLGGAQTGAEVTELAEVCLTLLEESQRLIRMQEKMKSQSMPNAAMSIYDTMEQQCEVLATVKEKIETSDMIDYLRMMEKGFKTI